AAFDLGVYGSKTTLICFILGDSHRRGFDLSLDWCEKLVNRGLVPKDDPSFKEFVLFATLYVESIWKKRNSIIHGGTMRTFEVIHTSLTSSFFCYREPIL
ncbi:LOW QUALITY PROTEIN: hypothetical protein TorRG33x02_070410, partial [Trema orientale]